MYDPRKDIAEIRELLLAAVALPQDSSIEARKEVYKEIREKFVALQPKLTKRQWLPLNDSWQRIYDIDHFKKVFWDEEDKDSTLRFFDYLAQAYGKLP